MLHINSILKTTFRVMDHMIPCHDTALHDVQDYYRAKFRTEMTINQKMATAPVDIRTHPSNQ
jgi:hypothetical protein